MQRKQKLFVKMMSFFEEIVNSAGDFLNDNISH